MHGINLKRVIVGGLLAGLLINVSETILNLFVAADDMAAALEAANTQMAAWAIPFFVVVAFLWGIALTGLYAAVRPRFGPGPATAIGVGATFWAFVSLIPTFSYAAMGFTTGSPGGTVLALAWTLVEFTLAAALGAWVYHEGATADPAMPGSWSAAR